MNTRKFKRRNCNIPMFEPNLNRSELARSVGVDRSHISRILSGKIKPNITTLRKLAHALGASLDEIDKFVSRAKQSAVKP